MKATIWNLKIPPNHRTAYVINASEFLTTINHIKIDLRNKEMEVFHFAVCLIFIWKDNDEL